MGKLIRIFERTQPINFLSPQNEYNLYRSSFLSSELGWIYQGIPWKELILSFGLRDKGHGPDSLFSPQGKLALMFLKSYTNFSDRKLIESVNGNLHYQMFCGIMLKAGESLKDFKIVSRIRTELGARFDLDRCQQDLARAWKPLMNQTHVMLEDATCYETQMRYPTNVKLLWESVDWMYHQMALMCKHCKVRMPRSKYLDQKQKYYNYQRRKVIRKVYRQQLQMFRTGESIPDRIVSLSKSYIRPIVRGKEVKKVEFGAKVNTIQIDGLNFIEHLSFNAFNEGTRLKKSVWLARQLFGRITHLAADAIYATNANRSYCTAKHITTNFKRKGRAGKYEDQRQMISRELNIERSTRMEGSFGTEKEHYSLQRIKARTEQNEVIWIFFGIHTANLARLAQRIKAKHQRKAS
ncbi:hypothetical protein AQPE_3438 [Aquipluma nitroreducens]|uniref:Transposase n=1 Tax=Aquipluma nitroreducens TaxID=2010828 RepID=A0A5K7SCE4_9BACT|nr:transposase [Aquipluma nitroreducens]BBE19262.1 hypothetical protein AQPE_3438 [Aquipluma nitroreducens]